MRLGMVLWKIKKFHRLESLWVTHDLSYRFRGKYRKVPEPKYHDLLQLKRDFEREEENMLILRHPYLTEEQSFGHMTEIKQKKKAEECSIVETAAQMKNEKFNKITTSYDRLSHLRINESWD